MSETTMKVVQRHPFRSRKVTLGDNLIHSFLLTQMAFMMNPRRWILFFVITLHVLCVFSDVAQCTKIFPCISPRCEIMQDSAEEEFQDFCTSSGHSSIPSPMDKDLNKVYEAGERVCESHAVVTENIREGSDQIVRTGALVSTEILKGTGGAINSTAKIAVQSVNDASIRLALHTDHLLENGPTIDLSNNRTKGSMLTVGLALTSAHQIDSEVMQRRSHPTAPKRGTPKGILLSGIHNTIRTVFCVEVLEQCFEICGSNRDTVDGLLNKAKDK